MTLEASETLGSGPSSLEAVLWQDLVCTSLWELNSSYRTG